MANQPNFYITAPNANNFRIVFKNGEFERACLKCGEAINQSVETRLKQEASQAGNMKPLFQFYVDPARIDTSRKSRKSNFDHVLFGHQQITNKYKSTIWKNIPIGLIPTAVYHEENDGRREFMDFAKLLNSWMKSSESAAVCAKIIENLEFNSEAYCKSVLLLIEKLLNENMPALVEKYTDAKIDKTELNLFNHQILGLRHIIKMLSEGKRNIIAQLPCRWGKTLAFLDLFMHSPWKLMIVASYVKTVGNSYIKEASAYKDFEDMQTVDIDNCDGFKYNGKKTMVVFPMTGDIETIKRRIKALKRIAKTLNADADDMLLLNEEADYGNHTEKADDKFKMLVAALGKMTVISTTGTEAHKAEKLDAFGDADGRISCNPNDWNQFFV